MRHQRQPSNPTDQDHGPFEWGPHKFISNALCPDCYPDQRAHAIWDQSLHGKTPDNRKSKEIPLQSLWRPSEVAQCGAIPGQCASDFCSAVSLSLDGGMTIAPLEVRAGRTLAWTMIGLVSEFCLESESRQRRQESLSIDHLAWSLSR